jgi:hypothetical protein
MPYDPIMNPFAYWDDDMDRQLVDYAKGAVAYDPLAESLKAQDVASKVLGPDGGNAFGEGVLDHYQGTGPGYTGPMQPPAPDPPLSPRVAAMMQATDAATNALGQAGGDAFGEGVMNHIQGQGSQSGPFGAPSSHQRYAMGAPADRAYIAQSTGPVGTIGTMGQGVPGAAGGLPLGDVSGLSDELAAATPAGIEMPDDYVGKPTIGYPTEVIEMGDDFVGRQAVNQSDPMPPEVPADDPIGASVRDGLGLEPDAISGGVVPGQIPSEAQPTDDGLMTPDEMLPLQERAARLAADPERLLQEEMDLEERRAEEARRRQHEIDYQDQRQREWHAHSLQVAHRKAAEKSAQLDAEAFNLANTKIDPLSDVSAGRKIAGVLAAALGGLTSRANGGRNTGLEAVDGMIQQSIQTQTANLQNRKDMLGKRQNAVAEELARSEDLHEAQDRIRRATYDHHIRQLQTEMQNFEPGGTQFIRRAKAIAHMQAVRAEGDRKFEAEKFERDYKAQQHNLNVDKFLLDAARAEPEIIAKWQKLQGGTGAAKRKPDYFATLGLPVPPFDMTDKEHAQWMAHRKTAKDLDGNDAKSRKEAADATKAEAEAAAATKGYFVMNPETREPLVDKEGNPVAIPDSGKRERLEKQIGAAKNIRIVADRMTALKDKNGGNWTALGSDEAQEMKTLVSMLDFETFKAFDLGAPSEGDKALAEGVRGGVDPSSFIKKSTKGFQAYADAVERKVNTALGVAGIEPLRFARRADAKKAEKTAPDIFAQRIASAEYNPTAPGPAQLQLPRASVRNLADAPKSKAVEEAFAALDAYADQPGDMGDQARKSLAELAERAVSPAARARAKEILAKHATSPARTDEAR